MTICWLVGAARSYWQCASCSHTMFAVYFFNRSVYTQTFRPGNGKGPIPREGTGP